MLIVGSTGPETARARLISGLEAWSPHILGLARIIAGLQFLEHGLMKLVHFPAPDPAIVGPLSPFLLLAGIIEVVGGVLIAAGIFTRTAAFICSGEVAVAYFQFHARQSFWPAINQGDAAIQFCFFFLYLVFAGPGGFSLQGAGARSSR